MKQKEILKQIINSISQIERNCNTCERKNNKKNDPICQNCKVVNCWKMNETHIERYTNDILLLQK